MKAAAAFLLVLCHLAISHAWKCNEGPRLYNAFQIDAGQGQVVAKDRFGYIYFLVGSSWYRLSHLRFKHSSIGPAGLWASGTSGQVYKFVGGNFRPTSGPSMLQVDAGGAGQVVGVSTSSQANCLKSTIASAYAGTGSLNWSSLSKVMTYISCGPRYGCWGVDSSNRIYFTQTITPTTCRTSGWSQVSGAARMVEVGTDGTVFVVNAGGYVFQRVGISSTRKQGTGWALIRMCTAVRHVSYDLGTLWVVTNSGLLLKCTH